MSSGLLPGDGIRRFWFLCLALAIVALDQWTKALILRDIPLYSSIPVIAGFFEITHVQNTGAAFGILADSAGPYKTWILSGIALVILGAVIIYSLKTPVRAYLIQAGLALTMGGAAGNLIDRFRFGSVTDFLHFFIGRYSWPSFNVADSAITVGVALLAWEMWHQPAEEKGQTEDSGGTGRVA